MRLNSKIIVATNDLLFTNFGEDNVSIVQWTKVNIEVSSSRQIINQD